jgi:ABC-type bacteriocin/lantibiotic exporter with double-glycine peptidase domain
MRLNRLDNATSAAIHFSEALGYPTQNSFIDEIVKHPFYPSLLSLSEVLENEAGVKNFAVKIETDQLKEVNFPCLAHLQTKGGQYVLINALENDTVFYQLDGKNLKLSLTDFEKLWTGVILISESEKKVLKRKLNFNYLVQYILPVLSGLLLLFIIQKAYITTKISLFPFIGQNVILLAGLIVSV